MLETVVFDGWPGLVKVLVAAPAAYLALVVILRASGKRTLSKLNAFDLVITIALGSTLAATITNESLSLTEGVAAMALLVALQFLVTAAAVRSAGVNRIIKAEPTLLLRRGELLQSAMRRQRVTADEIAAAARASGVEDLGDVQAVVLETDGSLSILKDGAVG